MSHRRGDRTVTAIERQKRNRQRVTVFLDGQFGFSLDSETYAQAGLRTGDSLSERRVGEILSLELEQRARRTALRFVRSRLRSEHEVRVKLEAMEIPPAVINRVVARLRESGLIDDRRFAEAFLHDLALRDIAGVRAVQERMRRKGLGTTVIAEALADAATPERQHELALASARRYLRRRQKQRTPADLLHLRRNVMMYLGRRGFEWAVIASVLRSLPVFRNVPSEEP